MCPGFEQSTKVGTAKSTPPPRRFRSTPYTHISIHTHHPKSKLFPKIFLRAWNKVWASVLLQKVDQKIYHWTYYLFYNLISSLKRESDLSTPPNNKYCERRRLCVCVPLIKLLLYCLSLILGFVFRKHFYLVYPHNAIRCFLCFKLLSIFDYAHIFAFSLSRLNYAWIIYIQGGRTLRLDNNIVWRIDVLMNSLTTSNYH